MTNHRVFLAALCLALLMTYTSAIDTDKTVKPINVAFCLTGQLARLELASKIRNIFVPNARRGHNVHVFILLDNEVEKVKQTFWKFDYSDSPFFKFNSESMSSFLKERFESYNVSDKVKYWVRLETPVQSKYQVVGGVIPVSDKIIRHPNAKMGGEMPEGGKEPAAVRFQNNMRWLGGLRECVKWTQQLEFEQRIFYDLVIRLRDDTLAFGRWLLAYENLGNAITSAKTGSFRGVNDHNFVVDRRWADKLLRGFTEDYYFNDTLAKEPWGNPEYRIYQLAIANKVPIRNETVCQQPLVPLRGKYNSTHWLLHASYSHQLLEECNEPKTWRLHRCKCEASWKKMLEAGTVAVDLRNMNSYV